MKRVLILCTIAVSALLLARAAITSGLAHALPIEERRSVAIPPAPPSPMQPSRVQDFFARSAPRAPETPIETSHAGQDCASPFRLVATIVDEAHPQRSLATLRGPDKRSELLRSGGHVTGREIIAVHRTHVLLRDSAEGATCRLSMFTRSEETVREQPTTRIATSSAFPEITQVGERHYSLPRSAIERAMREPGLLRNLGRAHVRQQGGQDVGLALYGLPRSGILTALGLANGDIIRTINSMPVAGATPPVETYARLLHARHISVTVSRGGAETNLEYDIEVPP